MEEQGFSLADLRGAWDRRGRTATLVGLGVMLATIFVAAILPDIYEAQTVLLVEPQSVSERLVESGVPETDVNNRLHLIQMQILSRGRLSRVIDDLDVYPKLADTLTREEIIQRMRSDIHVQPMLPELATEARAQAGVRAADVAVNTFALSFEHPSAIQSADVANRLARDFIDEHIRDRQQVSEDTSVFIDAELAGLTTAIAGVEARIKDVKAANPGRLPEEFTATQRLFERATAAMRDAQRELSIASSDESFYRQQALSGGGDDSMLHPSFINPSRRIDILEVQLAEFGSRGFTEKHPDVIAARGEIERLRVEIATSGTETGNELTPSEQGARAEEQRAAQRAGAARSEIGRLQADLSGLAEHLAQTPAVAEQLAGLDREHHALLESYQDYSNKKVEASVASAMENRQKGERFRVLEAAFPPLDAVSPNRQIILVLGLLLAIASAGGFLVVMESADESYHSSRDLHERLGLPVLASIPEVVLASDVNAHRSKDRRQLLLAAMATVVVLVISTAGNWWVNGAPGAIVSVFGSESGSE